MRWFRQLFSAARPAAIAALVLPALLRAGLMYGSIVEAGRPVAGATIRVDCPSGSGGGVTAADGTFRFNVVPEGRCTFTLPQYGASAVAFSYARPTQYDFELRRQGGRAELIIR
jgi:hypothetical protein